MNGSSNQKKHDWLTWHYQYQDAKSPLRRRLSIVQREIHRALPGQLEYPYSVVSFCAGQGDDLIGVLRGYPSAALVRGRLIESEPSNVAKLMERAQAAGLHNLEIIREDASRTELYAGIVPANLVLLCGVFGNISNADIHRTICCLPQFCCYGATVVWTRSRRPPDLTPAIRDWFRNNQFIEIAFEAPDDALFTVGANRFQGAPRPLEKMRLFSFIE